MAKIEEVIQIKRLRKMCLNCNCLTDCKKWLEEKKLITYYPKANICDVK